MGICATSYLKSIHSTTFQRQYSLPYGSYIPPKNNRFYYINSNFREILKLLLTDSLFPGLVAHAIKIPRDVLIH